MSHFYEISLPICAIYITLLYANVYLHEISCRKPVYVCSIIIYYTLHIECEIILKWLISNKIFTCIW